MDSHFYSISNHYAKGEHYVSPYHPSLIFTDFEGCFKQITLSMDDALIFQVKIVSKPNGTRATVKLDRDCLEYRKYWTDSLLIVSDGTPIKQIVREHRQEALRANGHLIRFFEPAEMTPELCFLAVLSKGQSIGSIPKTLHTRELLEAAIESDSLAIEFMDQTEELCLLAIENRGSKKGTDLLAVLRKIKILTPAIAERLVMFEGLLLSQFSSEFKIENPSVCQAAIYQNPYALQWVPYEVQRLPEFNEPLFQALFEKGAILQWMDTSLQTESLCCTAARSSQEAFKWIQESMMTPDVLLLLKAEEEKEEVVRGNKVVSDDDDW